MKKFFWWLGFGLLTIPSLMGQRRLVIQGSSTAACVGPSSFDSCWVSILNRHFDTETATDVIQVAQSGYNPYHGMPSTFIPPANRPFPDANKNITQSLSFSPAAIVISYPSNQFNVYSVAEVMLRFRQIYQAATDAGVACFIMTPQPRHNAAGLPELNYSNSFTKKNMWEIRDSVMAQFGVYAINVWDSLVNPVDTTLRAEFDQGDHIHLNNAGHRFLSRAVIAANVFQNALPSSAVHFNGERLGNQHQLYWQNRGTEKIRSYELQWSATGRDFESIYQVAGDRSQYAYLHEKPAEGANWYRLKWVDEQGKSYFSTRKNLYRNLQSLLIQQRLFKANGWELQVYAPVRQWAHLLLLDAKGQLLWVTKTELKIGWQSILVPVQPYGPRALHILQVITDKQRLTEKLIRPF
jgi:hypothetical protein